MFSITIIIVAATCILSFIGFSNERLIDDLIFYPPAITNRNQWYRFITCGFIHADMMHLAFNMYSFYLFGQIIENTFTDDILFGEKGKFVFLILYLSSLVVCLLPTYFNNKNNYHYRSLGASGAVSAIVFGFIFLSPLERIGLIFIPFLHAPAFIFGIVYLFISAYLSKRGSSNINHSAHFWGAIYGIVFLIVVCQFMSSFRPVDNFIHQIQAYFK